VGTPGHIPNPAVKHSNTDGTYIVGRVGRRQLTMLNIKIKNRSYPAMVFYLVCYPQVLIV